MLPCAVLLATACFAGHARADANADSDRANLLFKKGKVAFNDGKYNDALRIYNEAWHLKQSPDIAANLAQTEAELGKHRAAAEHFAFALAHLLPSSTDEQKKALAEGLEIEKKEIGTLHVTLEPAESQLSIDDAPVTLPANGDLYVEGGDHRTSVTREGYESNAQTVHVSKGSSQVLWIKLLELGAARPSAAPAPAPADGSAPPRLSDDSSSRSLVPAILGGGLVVAGAAVGVVFLLAGNSSQDDADALGASTLKTPNACGANTRFVTDCGKLHDDNKAIDRDRTLEVTGFVVAGAAAIGTAVYLLWPHSTASTARLLTPTFAVMPGAGSLGLTGQF
ncbi:MAG: tetratricopeptide repeat protein [Polyangiaceae bacterium]